MSNSPRPQWGELEQICSFPVLMKFWQQGAGYIIPEEQDIDAPVFLDRGKDDPVKAAGAATDRTGTIVETSTASSVSASTGNSEHPSRLVNSQGKVIRNRAGRLDY